MIITGLDKESNISVVITEKGVGSFNVRDISKDEYTELNHLKETLMPLLLRGNNHVMELRCEDVKDFSNKLLSRVGSSENYLAKIGRWRNNEHTYTKKIGNIILAVLKSTPKERLMNILDMPFGKFKGTYNTNKKLFMLTDEGKDLLELYYYGNKPTRAYYSHAGYELVDRHKYNNKGLAWKVTIGACTEKL